MFQRIIAITKKETSQLLRDKVTLTIAMIMPIIMIVLFGFAISMNVRHIPTVVFDQSKDQSSREFLDRMVNSQYFDIVDDMQDQESVRFAIDDNEAQVGIIIPPKFDESLSGEDAEVLIFVDGSDAFVSLAAYSNANIVAQEFAIALVTTKINQSGAMLSAAAPFTANTRILYNPDLKDLWFVIPSLIAMILQVQSIVLMVSAVVRERELGTMEQILVTPIRPIELLIGKTIPNVVLLFFNLAMIFVIGIIGFGVPFRGNLFLFIGLVLIYIFACIGLGLFVSTVSENQTQAFQLNMVIMLIGLVVSGFIFPRNTLPGFIYYLGYLFPLTYFIPIARGVISKGIGISYLWPMVITLLFYAILILFIASKTFKQKMD